MRPRPAKSRMIRYEGGAVPDPVCVLRDGDGLVVKHVERVAGDGGELGLRLKSVNANYADLYRASGGCVCCRQGTVSKVSSRLPRSPAGKLVDRSIRMKPQALTAAPRLQAWAGSCGTPLSTTTLQDVVIYNNMRFEQEFEAHRLDQGGVQSVRHVS